MTKTAKVKKPKANSIKIRIRLLAYDYRLLDVSCEEIVETVKKTGAVVTCEEHSVIGGVGSAVSELLSTNYPVPMQMLGVDGVFGESGKAADLLEKHQLTIKGVIAKVKKVLKSK